MIGCEAKPPADVTDPGQLLFLGYTKKEVNCARCHGQQGAGGPDAPDIRTLFKIYDEEMVAEIIEEGKGEGPHAMPPFETQLKEEEVNLLVKFLKSIQAESKP
ncbi:cytochrome c [candidate division KSB1 bacterium]|nr:cytochrome c [candidate division KSB1 bacterium]